MDDILKRYIVDQAKDLYKKKEEYTNLGIETSRLKYLVDKYNIEDAEHWLQDRNDAEKKVKELVLDGDEHPFFSEVTLYELLGKENARTVLAVVNRLIESSLERPTRYFD